MLCTCSLDKALRNGNKLFFRTALGLLKVAEKELLKLSDVQSLMDGVRQVHGHTPGRCTHGIPYAS